MKLTELIKPWLNEPHLNCEIIGLSNDSRNISPGFVFLAYPGADNDGRLFMRMAASKGVAAVIYEPKDCPPDCFPPAIACLPLPGLAKNLALIASRFYGAPSAKITVTGVTGTNGKTTIAYQLAKAHSLLGQHAAYIGTLGQGNVDKLNELNNTTPDPICLQTLLYHYQKNNIQQLIMEVSSHALVQNRVDAIDFNQAIFTNLSHEHLDYHQSMSAYAAAKALLFSKETLTAVIVNTDDLYAKQMLAAIKQQSCRIISYGQQENALVRLLNWELSLTKTYFSISSPWGRHDLAINSLGMFNIFNTLAVFSSLMTYNYTIPQILAVIATLKSPPGRMEVVNDAPYIIVDYAHTPAALENALATLALIKKNRIIVVFGCGGGRWQSKRPIMGKIAAAYADILILTNDNPRSEDPNVIINAIAAGIDNKAIIVYKIPDRQAAILQAINLAKQDDTVLVAGKGHETYQQIGQVRYSFSDQEIIRKQSSQ